MTYLTISLVIGGEPLTIRPTVQRTAVSTFAPQASALGAVRLGDDLTVQTSGDPQAMRDIAAAFITVADLMDEENARIAGEAAQPTGGGYCPCSGVTDFYTDEDRTRWDELHAACDDVDPEVLHKHREIAQIAARRPDVFRGRRGMTDDAAELQPFEHAPGHRYGVQAGPNGMYARWCLVDGCTWRDTTSPAKRDDEAGAVNLGACTAVFLTCLIGTCLFLLAVMGGRSVMCKVHASDPTPISYCAVSK